MNEPLLEAMSCQRCIISVIGDHAGEGVEPIFKRKIKDIEETGMTFWVVMSRKATPAQVQKMCKTGAVYVIFVAPATAGGARPTVTNDIASEFSANAEDWRPLPKGISPVTGKFARQTSALVFDMLTVCKDKLELDLWNYADFEDPSMPLNLKLGCSTICAVRKDMAHHPDKLKSRIRHVVAIGRLAQPDCCVWVR